jgi:hypothetical protein
MRGGIEVADAFEAPLQVVGTVACAHDHRDRRIGRDVTVGSDGCEEQALELGPPGVLGDLLQQRIPRHVDRRRTVGLQLDLADDPTPQADDEHDTVVAGVDRERPKRLVEFEDDDRGGRDMPWQRALRYPGTVGERSSRRSVS